MDKLYDRDYAYWAEEIAAKLQQGKFLESDIENLVEEIQDMSKRERDKLLSSIHLIVHHLLKWDINRRNVPEFGKSLFKENEIILNFIWKIALVFKNIFVMNG